MTATLEPRTSLDAVTRTTATRVSTWVLATAVVAASLYGLLAETPYRSLPEATVVSARAQDACSIVVAALLVLLVRRPVMSVAARLARLGLLAYLLYSYLIYVTGVPMNRVFLVYVLIVSLSGAGLLGGLLRIRERPPASTASPRLTRTTGWVLVVTAVLFAGLWLSVLVPYALGGSTPEPGGRGRHAVPGVRARPRRRPARDRRCGRAAAARSSGGRRPGRGGDAQDPDAVHRAVGRSPPGPRDRRRRAPRSGRGAQPAAARGERVAHHAVAALVRTRPQPSPATLERSTP